MAAWLSHNGGPFPLEVAKFGHILPFLGEDNSMVVGMKYFGT